MEHAIAEFSKLVDELSVERWLAHPDYGDVVDSIIDVRALRAAVNYWDTRLPEEYKATMEYRTQLVQIELFIEKHTTTKHPLE